MSPDNQYPSLLPKCSFYPYFCHHRLVLLVFKCYLNEITQYVFWGGGVASLINIVFFDMNPHVFSNSLLFFLLCGIILYKETIIGLFIPRLVDISVIYTLGLFWIMLLCYYQNSCPLKIYTCTHFCEYIPRNVMSESQD